MSKTFILTYLNDTFILFIASFFGTFFVEKNRGLNNSSISLGKALHNTKKFLRAILNKNFWTFKFQKKFWRPIFTKEFYINVFSVFVSLLIFITIFKYYRYL